MKFVQVLMIAVLLSCFFSCQPDGPDIGNPVDGEIIDINEIDNTGNSDINVNMTELGRMLFWDPILSGGKDVACASCHHPSFGYADGRELPIGVGGVGLGPARQDLSTGNIGFVRRNSPTIINTAYNGMDADGQIFPSLAPMFWDNRTFSLEEQALGPILSFEEMRGHAFDEAIALDSVVNRLQENAEYQQLFESAFGNTNAINPAGIARAIATFERSIIATNSPFDQFQAGNQNAMTQNQIRGMNRFMQVGCDDCHSGPMFSDFELHVLGVPDNNQLDESDAGANGSYAFRTPTLRNLDETGPYFHNGVGGNLQETVDFYRTVRGFANGGNAGGGGGNNGLNVNPNVDRNDIDDDIRNLGNLNGDDIQEIVDFLRALDDPDFDRIIPQTVPSGLNPGGNIN